MKILLSSKDTGGQFSLIEGLMPPGGDGGLHLHANEDESMHLLEGELEVTIGDKKFSLASGESYFAPRNVPHRLRNRSQTPVRSILLTTPGGFDAFISQAGIRLMEGITPPVLSFWPVRMRTQVLVWSLARKASYTFPMPRKLSDDV
jgi:mannose-6-phosphate isomerase-like protein (cupin superfamily)